MIIMNKILKNIIICVVLFLFLHTLHEGGHTLALTLFGQEVHFKPDALLYSEIEIRFVFDTMPSQAYFYTMYYTIILAGVFPPFIVLIWLFHKKKIPFETFSLLLGVMLILASHDVSLFFDIGGGLADLFIGVMCGVWVILITLLCLIKEKEVYQNV